MDQQQLLNNAFAAYQRGELERARGLLREASGPKAAQLKALIARRGGALEAAAASIAGALREAPTDPEIAHTAGQIAADQGRLEAAERHYRQALSLRPELTQAHGSLARLLLNQRRHQDALEVYQQLTQIDPRSVVGRYGMASALVELGQPEPAVELLQGLIAQGDQRSAIRYMLGRAYSELGQTVAAIEQLRLAHNAEPTALTLQALAGAVWMGGDRKGFDQLLAASARQPGLLVTTAELSRQAGAPEHAVSLLRGAEPSFAVDANAVRALAQIDLGEAEAAEAAALACLRAQPGHRAAISSLISALLMQGRASDALAYAQTMGANEPDGQHWIAFEATALRVLGDPRYRQLVDLEAHVLAFKLPTPEGYSSLEEFNQAFQALLERWHDQQRRPLNQSLRHGTQTSVDLVTSTEPVVQAYIAALDEPIRRYLDAIGQNPDHPLTRRNKGRYRLAGCWSVRLGGGGYHINHVHPEGWISSAYYAVVPAEVDDEDAKPGWIGFDQPPFATHPATPARKWVKPEPGLVVLFPSYLWHGTRPIGPQSTRITAPFDVQPG